MSIKNDLNKYTPRIEQVDCLDFIKNTKKEQPDKKFYLLNMPVGIGKSHLALMISNWYTTEIDRNSRVDIITATKILQDQYDQTYESINNLKGKENYKCAQYACSCAQGKEFSKINKTKCDFCPFTDAKDRFISGKVSLTNFYLYLIYSMHPDIGVFDQRHSNLLIVDECHDFDDVISDFISLKVTESLIKRLKFNNEDKLIKELKSIKSIEDYVTFLKMFSSEIEQNIQDIYGSMDGLHPVETKRNVKINKLGSKSKVDGDIKMMQIISDLNQYKTKIDVFLVEYENNKDNWVLESSYNEKTKTKDLSLEPIWCGDFLDKYVWSKYDMVILMSGTILDRKLFSELNGIENNKSIYYSVPSPFPVENRPIYYMPLGKMSFAKKEETFNNYIEYIHKFLNKYKDKKGVIHTNSFELSNWIKASVSDDRLLFHESSDKDVKLAYHFETEAPTVFVSPSVGTGVSFDHEKGRFQIIAKIPYPSLASQKNKVRQKMNPHWYSWKTVCSLLQMTGRCVRSKTDFADTIIIDGSFGDILKYSSNLIPDWVQNSIKRIEVKQKI